MKTNSQRNVTVANNSRYSNSFSSRRDIRRLAAAAASAIVALVFSSEPVRAVYYTVTDLGSLSGLSSNASGINSSGQVFGNIVMADGSSDAFLYTNGNMVDLGSFMATGLSDSGEIVGWSTTSGTAYLVKTSNTGTVTSSVNLTADFPGSLGLPLPVGINNQGTVIANVPLGSIVQAFSFGTDASGQIILPTLTQLTSQNAAFVAGINNNGQITGSVVSSSPGVTTGFLNDGGSYTTIPALAGQIARAEMVPSALNNNAMVVGASLSVGPLNQFIDGQHAVVWTSATGTKDLGSLQGQQNSSALAINDNGSVVGVSSSSLIYSSSSSLFYPSGPVASSSETAFVWTPSGGMQNLNTLVGSSGTGWTLNEATGINNTGQIAATATNASGQTHAVLLTPTLATQLVSRTPSTVLTSNGTPGFLEVFVNGQFSPVSVAGAAIDPTKPTIVLTHGWNSDPSTWAQIVQTLQTSGTAANILAWDWAQDADTSALQLGLAASRTPEEGLALGNALKSILGTNYQQPLHYIGHSLGTLVNATAANTFHNGQTQVTMFDDGELANLFSGTNPLTWASPIPNPSSAEFIDNYVSAFGMIESGAANLILTRGPTALDPIAFHGYPFTWYNQTIGPPGANLAMGYRWAVENGGLNGSQPAAGSIYIQSINPVDSELTISPITQIAAIAALGTRDDAELLAGSVYSVYKIGQLSVDGVNGVIQYSGHLIVSILPPSPSSPDQSSTPMFVLSKHSPSYAWIPITVPTGATEMSFDFIFHGLSPEDFLSAGINDTELFALESQFTTDDAVNNSGYLDVSQWAGQDVEFFLGLNNSDDIPGGTITVQNVAFFGNEASVPEPSSLCLLALGGTLLLYRPRRVIM